MLGLGLRHPASSWSRCAQRDSPCAEPLDTVKMLPDKICMMFTNPPDLNMPDAILDYLTSPLQAVHDALDDGFSYADSVLYQQPRDPSSDMAEGVIGLLAASWRCVL